MKLSAIKSIIEKLEECDYVIENLNTTNIRADLNSLSPHMLDCVRGAVIERRISLLDQLKRQGIQVEV